MKFQELLKGNEFSNEVITKNYETQFSFEWDNGIELTEQGKKHFAKLLNSDTKILSNGNLLLLDESITFEQLNEFLSACAGYCPT